MAYSFLFGGDTKETPQTLARKRAMIEALSAQVMGETPKNAYEGIGAMLKGAAVGVGNYRTGQAEKAGRSAADDLFNKITGQAPDVSASSMLSPGIKPTSGSGAAGGSGSYRDAIASIESAGSGDYKAVGPTHPKMGRALGRYQIMEANIGPWSREALGREVTPEEFISNPQLQDAIFDHKFNGYVQQFGPEGAAQAWFAGPGGVGKTNRKDSLGTDVGTYGRKFMNALGPQGQPQEVASLDPSAGMPPQTAAGAVNAMAAGGGAPPPSLSDEVAAFEQTPQYQSQFPSQNVGGGASLRPFQAGEKRPNTDGSFSTELTTTWQLPSGEWVNVPSLWMGQNGPQQFNPDDEQGILGAMQTYESQNGPTFQRFRSAQEAEQAARARSNAGGAGAGPQARGIPSPFDQSAQLANAQGGIMPALMGGSPASPEQVAQAQAMGQQQPQPQPQQQGAPDQMSLLRALSNPFLSQEQRAVLQTLYQQQVQEQEAARDQQTWMERQRYEQEAQRNDPAYQIGLEKSRIELEDAKKPKQQPLINAGDGQVFDPNTQKWISSPTGGTKPPQVVELFDEATGQPYKATWNPETREYERVGGVKARSGMQLTTNPDGTVTLTEGAIGGLPKLTEAEGRNSGFYGRGVESHKLLNDLESEGTSLWNNTVGNVPVAGNYLRSEDAQKYDQAKRDYINAVLRRESGAVISPEEFSNAEKQYFPQPGDGPEVIEQKRKNRETTIQGLKISAGQGAAFAVPSEQPSQQKRGPVSIGGYTIEEVD
jgi:hypothetical protein